MARLFDYLPELEGDEALFTQKILDTLDDEKAETFSRVYRARRKDPFLILVMIIIGFAGIAGIHRIYMGHIGMGVLYLFTAGLCFIGTVVDAVNYKSLTYDYNRTIARDVYELVKIN